MKTICIMCPMGCPLEITSENGIVTVNGNTCRRGLDYGMQEYTSPKRVVTSLVEREDGGVLSVKTSAPVDKSAIKNVLKALKGYKVKAPVKIGSVLIRNVSGTGADIIATCDYN